MLDTVRVWLTANWLPLLVAVYLIGMMLYGHDRGFLKLAVSMFALILSIYLVKLALPKVSGYLRTHTSIETTIQKALLKQTGLDRMEEQELQSSAAQQQAIDSLALPDNIKKLLEVNNNADFWNRLGVRQFTEYVADYLSRLILNYAGFAILFVLVWILLHLLIRFADIFTRLPVLHGLNQIAGAVLGIAEALIYLWIAFFVLSALSGTPAGSKLLTMISQSRWLSWLFNNNFLSYLLKDIFYAMF